MRAAAVITLLSVLGTLSVGADQATMMDRVQDAMSRAETAGQELLEKSKSQPVATSDLRSDVADAMRKARSVPVPAVPKIQDIMHAGRTQQRHAFAQLEKQAENGGIMGKESPYAAVGKDHDIRVFILVSLSMPKTTLRNYLVQGRRINAALVLRGFVGGSFLKTRRALRELVAHDANNAVNTAIDPTLFARFGVKRVPAIVVTRGPFTPCTAAGCQVPENYIVQGDISLEGALVRVQQESATLDAALEPLLVALRGEE